MKSVFFSQFFFLYIMQFAEVVPEERSVEELLELFLFKLRHVNSIRVQYICPLENAICFCFEEIARLSAQLRSQQGAQCLILPEKSNVLESAAWLEELGQVEPEELRRLPAADALQFLEASLRKLDFEEWVGYASRLWQELSQLRGRLISLYTAIREEGVYISAYPFPNYYSFQKKTPAPVRLGVISDSQGPKNAKPAVVSDNDIQALSALGLCPLESAAGVQDSVAQRLKKRHLRERCFAFCKTPALSMETLLSAEFRQRLNNKDGSSTRDRRRNGGYFPKEKVLTYGEGTLFERYGILPESGLARFLPRLLALIH